MFIVNNNLYSQLWTYFALCSSVSSVNFEHVNTAWGDLKKLLKNALKKQPTFCVCSRKKKQRLAESLDFLPMLN